MLPSLPLHTCFLYIQNQTFPVMKATSGVGIGPTASRRVLYVTECSTVLGERMKCIVVRCSKYHCIPLWILVKDI